jgi:NADPH2:quinone reductase
MVSTPGTTRTVELRDVEEPAPAPNEAVVEVWASSLNRGELPLLDSRKDWRPGQDLAGVVVAAARDGSGPGVGTRVAGAADGASWSERVAVPTDRLGLLPDVVSFTDAAALPINGLTALRALRTVGPLFGSRVLVTGASGAVGRLAIQLAYMGGAEVTAVVSRPERMPGLAALGAERVLLGSEELAGPFDVVLEAIGGASLERSVHALAGGGVVVLYGVAAGEPGKLGLADFRGRPGATVVGFFIYGTDLTTFGADITLLGKFAAQGRLHAPVGLEVDWIHLSDGIDALRRREVNGKVVLRVRR